MDINEAILSFTTWDRPWQFERSVRASLKETDIGLFEAIWATALDKKHWISAPDLAGGSEAAAESLRDAFPRLSENAISAVANAATYQWK